MVPRIERDVVIEAPIDVVWRILTEPEHMRSWLAEDVRIDMQPGGAGFMDFRNGDAIERSHLRVEAMDAPRYFAYRWDHPAGEEPRPGNSTLVEFTLLAEDGGTRVRVVETGVDERPWTDEAKTAFARDHIEGWEQLLGSLHGYAPRQQAAAGE